MRTNLNNHAIVVGFGRVGRATTRALLEAGVAVAVCALVGCVATPSVPPAPEPPRAEKVRSALKAMSLGLGDTPWCCGNHFTLADVACGTALGYLDFRFPEIAWRGEYANLARLLTKLAARPSFVDTAPPAA